MKKREENTEQVNLNNIKFFIEAAQSNSFQEVADKMNYDISHISTRINKLEKELGVKLFTRNPLKLTEIGKEIYETALKGYKYLEFTQVIARSKNNMECGKVSICCPLNITKSYLIPRLKNVMQKYPDFKVKLVCETDYNRIMNSLKNNDIQFALLDYSPNDNDMKEFEIREVFESEYILVSNEQKYIKSIKELSDYNYITSEDYRFSTSKLINCFERNGIELNRSMICSLTEGRIEAAKMGLGIAYVLRESVKEELKNQELYEIKVPINLPKIKINLINLKNHLTKVDKKFINEYLINDKKSSM